MHPGMIGPDHPDHDKWDEWYTWASDAQREQGPYENCEGVEI